METRELPLDDLVLDQDLNLRDRLDDSAIERYAEVLDRLPPVTVFEVEGRWLLADGFHRHAAILNSGRRTIRAEVRPGTYTEALDFAAGANLAHGLPMTRAERRRTVEVKLRLHPDWADRRMADHLSVGRDLVSRVRQELVQAGQIPRSETRVGADGKTYPSAGLPRDPNEHLPRDRSPAEPADPRDRGGRESDPAPWDHASDPLPPDPGSSLPSGPISPPWDNPSPPDYKAAALADPASVATPTIDEMLALMTRQVSEVLAWTDAEGFATSYRAARPAARAAFLSAVSRLTERAEELRQG